MPVTIDREPDNARFVRHIKGFVAHAKLADFTNCAVRINEDNPSSGHEVRIAHDTGARP